MLELHTPEAAFERLERRLSEGGFFEGAADGLAADVFLELVSLTK